MTEPRPPAEGGAAAPTPGETRRTARLRWGLAAAGVALAALLVVMGVLSRDDSSRVWAGSGALLAVLVLATLLVAQLVAQLGQRVARPWLLYALVPVSAALATLTWLLGWVGFPGAWVWWVPGAIVSALPLWTLGFLGRRDAGHQATSRD
ncbi:hypothetical protein [Angustibacter sp. Root456]|uniref:hypothetical protein n=1 Tax=Angustibacter sp. Root456 TaxID=1736539 RepID=UPI0006F4BD28|nr:hypothetical protein [Angustibacter sp. Root456]KQX63618.1 hypothetical protein ASD06_10815 [Angustibacter sp. Root456]